MTLLCAHVSMSILYFAVFTKLQMLIELIFKFSPYSENILNRSEKSSNHSRIQFKTMIISGEMFGKIWYDPRCLVRYPSHKIPLSTDTREMVKAGNMWRKVMLSASEKGDTNQAAATKGETQQPSSCK